MSKVSLERLSFLHKEDSNYLVVWILLQAYPF